MPHIMLKVIKRGSGWIHNEDPTSFLPCLSSSSNIFRLLFCLEVHSTRGLYDIQMFTTHVYKYAFDIYIRITSVSQAKCSLNVLSQWVTQDRHRRHLWRPGKKEWMEKWQGSTYVCKYVYIYSIYIYTKIITNHII